MPILIILLFYINDLVRIKRYYAQTEYMAQQFANIIQNISNGQRITISHIKYAGALSWLSLYPGKTMYHTDTRSDRSHELSSYPWQIIYYVEGLSGGKASVKWVRYVHPEKNTVPDKMNSNYKTSDMYNSNVRWGTNVEPSSIYPTLRINEGEAKIIIECQLCVMPSTMSTADYNPSDDQSTCAKKAFRLKFLTPKTSGPGAESDRYFSSIVIFRPKDGLFTSTRP